MCVRGVEANILIEVDTFVTMYTCMLSSIWRIWYGAVCDIVD